MQGTGRCAGLARPVGPYALAPLVRTAPCSGGHRSRSAATAKKAVNKAAAHPGMRSDSGNGQGAASERITARIRELGDWRGEKLALVRRLIHEADPAVVEEWKWDTPVWSHDGIVCTGEAYK